MKKFLIIVILLLIILLSFGFAALKTAAQGRDDNYFNRHLRARFDRQPWLRNVLGLHYDGDAQTDYLGNRYKKILIEVDLMQNEVVQLSTLQGIAEKIGAATGKPTSYVVSDKDVPYALTTDDTRLGPLIRKYRNYKNSGDTATLYLLFASRDAGDGQTLGKTYQEYGLILFTDELQNFTRSNPDTLPNYEISTALHEFGHQIGLPHDTEPGCLMNETVEESRQAKERPADVVTDFCAYEESLISN